MNDAAALRVAVVGAAPYGFGARAHIPGIQAAVGVELAAVCTAHEETARAAAARWSVPKWYAGVDKLLDDDDIDIVTVAVKPRGHHPVAKAAVEAGRSVYCEWPLALDSTEAADLAGIAGTRSTATAVGLQGRWGPQLRYLRDLVASGRIGRPLSFDAVQGLARFDVAEDRSWLSHESEASGALYVATAHVTDAIRFVLAEPESVVGLRATLLPEDAYSDTGNPFQWHASDTVKYLARLPGGIIGSVSVSNITTPPIGFTLRIVGDQGSLAAHAREYYQFTPMTLWSGAAGSEMELIDIPDDYWRGTTLDESHPGANVGRSIAAFADSIRTGSRFRPDFADGLSLHRIIDALIESAESGAWALP